MSRLTMVLTVAVACAWAATAVAVPWDGDGSPPSGNGLWTTAVNWNPDAVPSGVSADINLNNASVSLNDGSTQTIAGINLATSNNVTASLAVSNNSLINVNGGLSMANGGTGSNATLTLTNATFSGVSGGEWVRRGGTAAVTMTNSTINASSGLAWAGANGAEGADTLNLGMTNSIINLSSGGLAIGSARNDQKVNFNTFDSTSQINIAAGGISLNGGNLSGPSGFAVYNLPLAALTATAGKIFAKNGVNSVATSNNAKATLTLDAAGTAGVNQSDPVLDWNSNGLAIATGGSGSQGIVNLTGMTLNNVTGSNWSRRGGTGTLNMTNSTINASGTFNIADFGEGANTFNLSMVNSKINMSSGDFGVATTNNNASNKEILNFTTFDSTSQININAGALRLSGSNTGGTLATYAIPLAAATGENGKIFAKNGLSAVGETAGSNVEVDLSSATSDSSINYNSGGLNVANAGGQASATGVLSLNGVSLTGISAVTLARRTADHATLKITNATLTKNQAGDNFYVSFGDSTSETAKVQLSSGIIAESVGDFYNRHTNGSPGSAVIQGTGSISLTGTSNFFQNGRIVADGGNLSISTTGGILNSNNLPVVQGDGTQCGLYAINTGKLTMPNLTVAANTAITWGEDSGDTTPDYVSSVRFTSLAGMSGSQTLVGSVLAKDNGSVPAGLINPIDIVDFSGLTFTSATMRFRYDDALASSLSIPESSLKLFHYTGGSWVDITGTIDQTNNWIDSLSFSSLSPFAIATGAQSPAVPEPSTYALGLMGLMVFGLIAWRRSSRS